METIKKTTRITAKGNSSNMKLTIRMAKGYTCPRCGYPMFAVYEDPQPNGRIRVTYQCRSCQHTLTVFE